MKNPAIAFAFLAIAAPMAWAVEVIADFTYDLSNTGTASPRPAAYDGQSNVFTNLNTTNSEYSNSVGTGWNQATVQAGTSANPIVIPMNDKSNPSTR